MRGRGIHYDTGTAPDGNNSRPEFDSTVAAAELAIIAGDLHCNTVRVSGGDPDRLTAAARLAADLGLQVWYSPHPTEMGSAQLRPYFLHCAQQAEQLRRDGADIVLVTGCELSLFTAGYLPGESFSDRTRTLTAKPEQRAAALAAIPSRINAFLHDLIPAIRDVYHGPVSYASIAIEQIDWSPFDIVGIDHYHSLRNATTYRDQLAAHFRHRKPVVITEVGCCTYRGAGDLGAAGWLVLQPDGSIKAGTIRDEAEQVRYQRRVLPILEQEGVDTAFWFTLAAYTLPHRSDPTRDHDLGSYGITKILADPSAPRTYPAIPWEPKAAFHALAASYAAAQSSHQAPRHRSASRRSGHRNGLKW